MKMAIAVMHREQIMQTRVQLAVVFFKCYTTV